MGQIWGFLRSVSVQFGSVSQIVLKLILKSRDLSSFGVTLTSVDIAEMRLSTNSNYVMSVRRVLDVGRGEGVERRGRKNEEITIIYGVSTCSKL